jgi:hypothetical protein
VTGAYPGSMTGADPHFGTACDDCDWAEYECADCGRDYDREEYEELDRHPVGTADCSEDGCEGTVSDECRKWRDCRERLR